MGDGHPRAHVTEHAPKRHPASTDCATRDAWVSTSLEDWFGWEPPHTTTTEAP